MELVYIINNRRDFDRFVSIYPDAKWTGNPPFVFHILVRFMRHSETDFPIALYYRPDGRVQWSRYDTALDLTTRSPFEYQWAELWPKLSTIDIFRKFLQHHGAYDKFLRHYLTSSAPMKGVVNHPALLVCDAFTWHNDESTATYWSGLSFDWLQLVTDLNLPTDPITDPYTQLFIIDGETNDNT